MVQPSQAASLEAATRQATAAFLERAMSAFPVQRAILYGSRARGDANPYSDADVAVVLGGEAIDRQDLLDVLMRLSDIAFDVLLDTGIRISPLPISEAEWAHPETSSNPRLLENIEREGVLL